MNTKSSLALDTLSSTLFHSFLSGLILVNADDRKTTKRVSDVVKMQKVRDVDLSI